MEDLMRKRNSDVSFRSGSDATRKHRGQASNISGLQVVLVVIALRSVVPSLAASSLLVRKEMNIMKACGKEAQDFGFGIDRGRRTSSVYPRTVVNVLYIVE